MQKVNCSFLPWCLQSETAPSFAYLYTRNLPLPGSCLRQTPSFWASPGASQLKQKRGGDEERIFWLWSHKRGSEILKRKNDMEKGVRDEKEEVRGQVMRVGALTQDTIE